VNRSERRYTQKMTKKAEQRNPHHCDGCQRPLSIGDPLYIGKDIEEKWLKVGECCRASALTDIFSIAVYAREGASYEEIQAALQSHPLGHLVESRI